LIYKILNKYKYSYCIISVTWYYNSINGSLVGEGKLWIMTPYSNNVSKRLCFVSAVYVSNNVQLGTLYSLMIRESTIGI